MNVSINVSIKALHNIFLFINKIPPLHMCNLLSFACVARFSVHFQFAAIDSLYLRLFRFMQMQSCNLIECMVRARMATSDGGCCCYRMPLVAYFLQCSWQKFSDNFSVSLFSLFTGALMASNNSDLFAWRPHENWTFVVRSTENINIERSCSFMSDTQVRLVCSGKESQSRRYKNSRQYNRWFRWLGR